ncbi:PAT complex subunit CCDC47 [Hetaerina americana]|uniref:PAT complex subunit CCDC47 n=1 Tax=Hetaerina americana TaxID=62018 RepID=UPI003A7F1FEF
MKLVISLLLLVVIVIFSETSAHFRDLDDEFAEFEDFEDEDEDTAGSSAKDPSVMTASLPSRSNGGDQDGSKVQRGGPKDSLEDEDMDEDDEAVVEDDDGEFDHFQDEEEFEGFDSDRVGGNGKGDSKEAPKITITKVPLHLRTNWDSFYLEMLMVAGLLVYFLNFFAGKSRNNKLANAWFNTHRNLLEDNFSLVGDDGKVENDSSGNSGNSGNVVGLVKESENVYTLWCSGRTCCEGMLVELKFLKRQDLVAVISQLLRPGSGSGSSVDQVLVRVEMNKEDMDSFVLCVAARKTALRLGKDMSDLSLFCPERRQADKYGGPSGMLVLSEMSEVASSLLDSRLLTVLNRYTDYIDYIHFSDQFSGPKPEDSAPTKLPETKKVLLFGFNIPPCKSRTVTEVMEQMRPLMQLVFYCMEKVKRFRLSKEAKSKADKNRLRVEEAFLKTTHAARAEAAAARREERKRQEKERILQEEDPEKQRKWEEREARRQMKKRAPKMKQLKVKAL